MKIYAVIWIIIFSLATYILSQVNFVAHTITISADAAKSVYALDIDRDGDMDVLSASGDDKIAWYENDGNQNFTPYTITTDADFASSVYVEDVDNDGDMDVLSASVLDNKIAWYENDGNQNFMPHIITINADGAVSVYALDIDGDGDMDVLSASANDDKIAWYENDGKQNFTPRIVTTNAEGAHSVYALDMDGDGDADVLSASIYDDKIAWYENLRVVSTEENHPPAVLLDFHLYDNYPNPFNPETVIAFDIRHNAHVTLKIYDIQGREVKTLVNEWQSAGKKSTVWDGRDVSGKTVSSGLYIYRMQAGEFVQSQKMLLLK